MAVRAQCEGLCDCRRVAWGIWGAPILMEVVGKQAQKHIKTHRSPRVSSSHCLGWGLRLSGRALGLFLVGAPGCRQRCLRAQVFLSPDVADSDACVAPSSAIPPHLLLSFPCSHLSAAPIWPLPLPVRLSQGRAPPLDCPLSEANKPQGWRFSALPVCWPPLGAARASPWGGDICPTLQRRPRRPSGDSDGI